jgi:hypothetical protein
MKKLVFIFFCVMCFHLNAQTNVVILEKKGENVKTYATGMEITFETIYYSEDGVLLMIAGGGVLLLNAVNGAYRGDKAKSWYTSGSIITAAALIIGGFLLTKSRFKTYHLGKKYTLEYLALDLDKK